MKGSDVGSQHHAAETCFRRTPHWRRYTMITKRERRTERPSVLATLRYFPFAAGGTADACSCSLLERPSVSEILTFMTEAALASWRFLEGGDLTRRREIRD